jgi:hypothetical protein
MRANFFAGGKQAEPGDNVQSASLIFQRHKRKILEPIVIAKIPPRWRQRKALGVSLMSQSLLDECHESILKIAATQPPEGKRAILIMAETFRANAGGASSVAQPSSSQDFHAPGRQPVRPRRLRSRRPSQ